MTVCVDTCSCFGVRRRKLAMISSRKRARIRNETSLLFVFADVTSSFGAEFCASRALLLGWSLGIAGWYLATPPVLFSGGVSASSATFHADAASLGRFIVD